MSTETQLGTAELQGRLWTVNAANWAELHEQYTQPAYVAALDALGVGEGTRLLDIGCGAGLALQLAVARGADASGLDASPGLLEYARRRAPDAGAGVVGEKDAGFDFEGSCTDLKGGVGFA